FSNTKDISTKTENCLCQNEGKCSFFHEVSDFGDGSWKGFMEENGSFDRINRLFCLKNLFFYIDTDRSKKENGT
ncbi:hypothetical protein, partial [Bacillus altitudinis]|uniref:hypothetical protein n=1 Tax=Bacillus altitudinis TaxID=293387 RepID=UPI0033984FCA